MAQEYASKQSQGFKNHIENVAIVGAGGQSGKFIVEALLKAGKHKITAITREGSTNKIPDGVTVKKVDYDSPSSLAESLKGQDALVITMGVTAPPDTQSKLVEAAAAAGVSWVIPNEFGGDGINEEVGRDTMFGPAKKAVRDHIERLGKSSWIGIACGFWYEFSLGGGPARYGFDFKNRTVTFFDDGTMRINTSTWPQTGRSVSNMLALKVLPENENDNGPCLSQFRNKFAYVSSFTINQKEMFESVLRVTGTSASDWKTTNVPVKQYYQEGVEQMKSGDRTGFAKLMYSRMFFPDEAGNYGALKGLDNDKLGLPKEDLDEFTKVGVYLHDSGYFNNLY
ncbi:putative oxidoreductase CipA [Cenococcum geophilum 1.58]|uniref:putative oxidoreductase CipA n=1 Tax=Cenococcum geophilum 1.58 TaxID=794803 RepID=UPI00358FBBEB|nr:putative oxidoreductase CipA [Cenococcum geophilum 1.58]